MEADVRRRLEVSCCLRILY